MNDPIFVQGRRIFLRNGQRTQTVNVCTAHNEAGTYAVVYRLDAGSVTQHDLRLFTSLADLELWLRGRGAVDEGPRELDRSGPASPFTAVARPSSVRPNAAPRGPAQPARHAPAAAPRPRPDATRPGRVSASSLAGRRVLVLVGESPVLAAMEKERLTMLGAEVGENLTRAVTDVIVLPGVPHDDNRLLKAHAWGLRILTPSDLPAR